MAGRHVRHGDIVEVLTGDDKGKQGRILSVLVKDQKVVVEGVNYIWKHLRRTQQHPEGGRLQKEAPIHWSNVRLAGEREKETAK